MSFDGFCVIAGSNVLLVQKFGGTSVGSIERIKGVAQRVAASVKDGNNIVVVVSAMSGETNRLLELCGHFTEDNRDREVDAIVSTGEEVSSALLALALKDIGVSAKSYRAHQVKILTDDKHGQARIKSVETQKLLDAIQNDQVAVVTGFQGVDSENNVTTLGRGGSDTTAVALAAGLSADACEIYTDVQGVFTTDPNVVPSARKIDRISYEEMLDLSSLGAKVLQLRSVEFGMKYNVPIHVRSSFESAPGTWVVKADKKMESVKVSGVTMAKNEARVTVSGLPEQNDTMSKIFGSLTDEGIVVDMILKTESSGGLIDVTFTVPRQDMERSRLRLAKEFGGTSSFKISSNDKIAKVSVVGLGMRSHYGVANTMFSILSKEGIKVDFVTTSEINISVVIDEKYGELALRSLHDGFGLHENPDFE